MAERVNGILKEEFLLDEKFANKASAVKAVKEAIESLIPAVHPGH